MEGTVRRAKSHLTTSLVFFCFIGTISGVFVVILRPYSISYGEWMEMDRMQLVPLVFLVPLLLLGLLLVMQSLVISLFGKVASATIVESGPLPHCVNYIVYQFTASGKNIIVRDNVDAMPSLNGAPIKKYEVGRTVKVKYLTLNPHFFYRYRG